MELAFTIVVSGIHDKTLPFETQFVVNSMWHDCQGLLCLILHSRGMLFIAACAELCGLCLQDDGLSTADMATVLNAFQGQSLDFFGALRSATYDNQIRSWIKEIVKGDIDADGAAMQELSRRLINRLLSGISPCLLQVQMLLAACLHEHSLR